MIEAALPPLGLHVREYGEERRKRQSPFFNRFVRNKVQYIENECDSALSFHEKDRKREVRATKFYTSLENGQWSDELNALVDSGELDIDRSQYNMVMKKINGFVGTVSENPFDIDFKPVDSENLDSSIMLRDLLRREKNLTKWDHQFKEAMRYGMIHNAFLMIHIDTSKSKFGNIGLKFVKNSKVLTDPNWTSQTMSDCKWAITVKYMTAHEASMMYPHMSLKIADRVNQMTDNIYYSTPEGQRRSREEYFEQVSNDHYRFLEYHHIVEEKETCRTGMDKNGNIIQVPSPPSNVQDRDEVQEWLQSWYSKNGIIPDTIREYQEYVKNYYVTTVCASLNSYEPFEDDLGKTQCGRLPFFNISFLRHDGRNVGFADILMDPQVNLNKRMSLITEILAKSAKDALIAEPDAFGNDPVKMANFKKNSSKPGYVEFAKRGFIGDGGRVFEQVPKAQYPQLEIFSSQQMMDMINTITPQTITMDGLSDSSKETGILFDHKRSQGELNTSFVFDMVERMWDEVGEACIPLLQNLRSGMYMKMNVGEDNRTIEINKRGIDANGVEYIENDISMIPAQSVIVSKSPKGVNRRYQDRVSYMELYRMTPDTMPLTKAFYAQKFIENLDSFNEKTLEEIKQVNAKDLELIISQNAAATSNAQLNAGMASIQLEQMLAQAQQGQQAQAPQGQSQQTGNEIQRNAQNQQRGLEQMPARSPEEVA